MLLYSTLLIIALALAIGIIWFYRKTTDASKAIYTTILPETLEAKPTEHLKQAEGQKAAHVVKDPWGKKQHATPATVARTNAAVPADKAPWGWPGHERHAHDKHHHHRQGKARHCSLYDNPATEPAEIRDQNVGWPYREDVAGSGGAAYRVSRKSLPTSKKGKPSLKTINKPWGW